MCCTHFKKSPKGIRTDKRDVDMVRERLKRAQEDYETKPTAAKETKR